MGKTAITINGDDAKSVYPAIIIAVSAAATGDEVVLFFSPFGAPIMLKGAFEKMNEETEHMPDLMEMVDGLKMLGAKFLVCELAFEFHGFKEEDLIEEAEVVGATTFVGAAQGAELTLSF